MTREQAVVLFSEELIARFENTPTEDQRDLLKDADPQMRSMAYWLLHPRETKVRTYVGQLWTYK